LGDEKIEVELNLKEKKKYIKKNIPIQLTVVQIIIHEAIPITFSVGRQKKTWDFCE
jgi:hypothetical protein